ncbi:hypothetical protein PVA38_12025 [Streptococcus pneumoniae D39]|nr:hypothetical protein PVA38_12025 [Streptococcus pneumoniae D39]
MSLVIQTFLGSHNQNWCRNSLFTVSYTHLRAHETVLDLVCRLLLEKKKLFLQTTLLRSWF